MKKILLIFLSFALLIDTLLAQVNMVPNASFEQSSGCPTQQAQIANATGWYSYTESTPDYLSCTSTIVGIPGNFAGKQNPAHGNAYAGIISISSSSASLYKEYLANNIATLTPMQIYEVSMSVSLGDLSRFATNDLGVFFFDKGPVSLSSTPTQYTTLVPVTPQVSFKNYGVIKDTQNWVRVTGRFLADSAYRYMVIGGFDNLTTMKIDTVFNSPNATTYAYYYIDSVVVRVADSLAFLTKDTILCSGDVININYSVGKKKLSTNVFTIQLSDANGSFAAPVNIGTRSSDTSGIITVTIPTGTPTGTGYRMRLISSNFADTSFESPVFRIGKGPVIKPVSGNNGPVCSSSSLSLTASSTTAGVAYKWTGPNNFISNLQNPVITNAKKENSGTYIVTAYLHGCTGKDTTTVDAIYDAIADYIPVCLNDTLKLLGGANAVVTSYTWTGPNSFTSTLQNPIITPATNASGGKYILETSNGLCSAKDTITVVIKPFPANINGSSNSPVCTGLPVNFSASSATSGVVFTWSGPNSYTSTGASVAIGSAAIIHAGDYYVAASLNGCAIKDTVTLVIKQSPSKPDVTTNAPICSGATLFLNAALPPTDVTYVWTGPGNFTSIVQNPFFSNATTSLSGDYILTATHSNGCTAKTVKTILVKPLPAGTTFSNSPVCATGKLSVGVGNTTSNATYAWQGPDNFSAATQAADRNNVTLNATGWYVATITLDGCSIKDSTYAVINPIPAMPTISYNNPLCAGQTLNLSTGNTTGATYSWTGTGNYTAAAQNATRTNMQYSDTGEYKLAVTVNGCTSPVAEIHVKINPVPFVTIFAAKDTICHGQQASFTALPNNHGGTPTYQWFINNTLAGTGVNYNSTSLSNNDIISCDMTEYTKCHNAHIDTSNDVRITVMPWLTPSVTFIASPNRPLQENEYITFTATPVNAGVFPTYQWKRNTQNVQGATGNTWAANTLTDNDVITVEVFSSYMCPQPVSALSTNNVKVRVLTGISNAPTDNRLKVYPIPAKDYIVFEMKQQLKEAMVTITNNLGQVLHQKDIAGTTTVDTRSLPAGIYVYKLTVNAETIQLGKIIIEK